MAHAKGGTDMVDKSPKNFSAKRVVLLVLALFFCPAAHAVQSLALAWSPSTSPDVAGYHIYYGTNATNFQQYEDAGTNTSYEVSGLTEGQTITFAITAYNAKGVESPTSNLITYIVPGGLNVAPKAGERSPSVINFTVAAGHTYKVQASGDLITWSTIWQTTATNNAWTQFEDIMGAHMRMRYYRLAWN
jgi:fibronectin type 3 domain-containing protein